jgi:hypothetical protein
LAALDHIFAATSSFSLMHKDDPSLEPPVTRKVLWSERRVPLATTRGVFMLEISLQPAFWFVKSSVSHELRINEFNLPEAPPQIITEVLLTAHAVGFSPRVVVILGSAIQTWFNELKISAEFRLIPPPRATIDAVREAIPTEKEEDKEEKG